MTGAVFLAVEELSTLSLNNENLHKSTMMSYAEVVNNVLRPYGTEAVKCQADEKIRILKQGLWARWVLYQSSWHLTLIFEGVYK